MQYYFGFIIGDKKDPAKQPVTEPLDVHFAFGDEACEYDHL